MVPGMAEPSGAASSANDIDITGDGKGLWDLTGDSTLPNGELASAEPGAGFAPRGDSAFDALLESYEDIKDAVLDNETFIAARKVAVNVSGVASSAWAFSKRAAWIMGTTALVLVIPLLYEIDKELGQGDTPTVDTTTAASGSADAAGATASGTASATSPASTGTSSG